MTEISIIAKDRIRNCTTQADKIGENIGEETYRDLSIS
jgi:hypothetical protein